MPRRKLAKSPRDPIQNAAQTFTADGTRYENANRKESGDTEAPASHVIDAAGTSGEEKRANAMAANSKTSPGNPEGPNGPKPLQVVDLGAAGDAPGVDKIRELLFGNQMQDYDRRFSMLGESFHQKLRDVESETARSLSNLETNLKKQLDSVAGQVREEKDLRTDADKELGHKILESTQVLEKRIGQLSDQLARLERDMGDRVSHDVQGLRDEIKRRNDDTRSTLDRMFAELREVKTDRTLLAGLFVEVARCLNQELPPPFANKGGGGDRS
jgi:hypothetical protein